MHRTKIDWADFTWNPVWGCLNSCPYCYARATAKRWGISFEPHWRERNFNRAMPKQPARIFVNSMSDICYWQPEWWDKVLNRIAENPKHGFFFLTKNPLVYDCRAFPENCWLGVTITTKAAMEAFADALFITHWDERYKMFISMEPMLEAIPLYVTPDWLILGAETGNRPGRVIPRPGWIEPFLDLPIPLYMKANLPWAGRWRKEFPNAKNGAKAVQPEEPVVIPGTIPEEENAE